jgi:hypothetical protein
LTNQIVVGEDGDGFNCVRAQKTSHRLALNRIVLDDENPMHPLSELHFQLLQNVS